MGVSGRFRLGLMDTTMQTRRPPPGRGLAKFGTVLAHFISEARAFYSCGTTASRTQNDWVQDGSHKSRWIYRAHSQTIGSGTCCGAHESVLSLWVSETGFQLASF